MTRSSIATTTGLVAESSFELVYEKGRVEHCSCFIGDGYGREVLIFACFSKCADASCKM